MHSLLWSGEKEKDNMNDYNVSMEAEQTIDFLLQLARYVEPLEHENGRIRVRVSLTHLTSVMALLGGVDVTSGVRTIPGLEGYEVNPWLRSAIIRYDPKVLSFELWDDFCAIRRNPSAEQSMRDRLLSIFQRHSK